MTELCEGKILLTKKLLKEGVTNECHNHATMYCEDCGKLFCRYHIDRDKHKCDDSIKGCHSIWKEK